MLTVNVITSDDRKVLSGAINGERFNVPYTEDTFDSLNEKQLELEDISERDAYDKWVIAVKSILEEKVTDIIETSCPDLKKDPRTGKYFVVVEGKVSKKSVPESLVKVLLESSEKDIDPTPIVKSWIRFLRNPNFTVQRLSYLLFI